MTSGAQLAELLRVDAIDRERLADDAADLAVDLGAGAVGIELGLGEGGQARDRGRIVALVRAADSWDSKPSAQTISVALGSKADDSMHAGLLAFGDSVRLLRAAAAVITARRRCAPLA